MDERYHRQVEWKYVTGLTNGQVLVVPMCCENSPETVTDASGLRWASFSLFSTVATTVVLQGAVLASFALPRILASLAVPAATFTTSYSLPAAMATDGRIGITLPFIRWQLTDTGGGSAVTEFYGKAWL